MKRFENWEAFAQNDDIKEACAAAHVDIADLVTDKYASWTLAVLEELKPKSKKIRLGALRNVLQSAMPLRTDFRLSLNGERVISIKESYKKVVEFKVADLPETRLKSLRANTREDWRVEGDKLISDTFPQGITGAAFVTEQTLAGKSDDLFRSNGFFVSVRGRLINEQDPLFGVHIPSFQTFNRFRAEVEADDLDSVLMATREGVEDSWTKTVFQLLLVEIYLEARQRYSTFMAKADSADTYKGETERNFVNQRLVEQPVADVLATQSTDDGAEATGEWFYLSVDSNIDVKQVAAGLYGRQGESLSRRRYRYTYTALGPAERMVKFDPSESKFTINEAHSFVRAHIDEGRSRALLEDILTSEALLEVYLRENHVPGHIIGEVLERRDQLLRSLAHDHPYSVGFIAETLRDAAANERDLEIEVVTAARALGFIATQVSGAGEPDGVSR